LFTSVSELTASTRLTVGQNGQKDDKKCGCVLVDLHGVGVPWAVFGLGSKTSVLIAPMWQAVQLKISPASEQNGEESDTSCVMPLMTCNYWAAQNGKSTVGSWWGKYLWLRPDKLRSLRPPGSKSNLINSTINMRSHKSALAKGEKLEGKDIPGCINK